MTRPLRFAIIVTLNGCCPLEARPPDEVAGGLGVQHAEVREAGDECLVGGAGLSVVGLPAVLNVVSGRDTYADAVVAVFELVARC